MGFLSNADIGIDLGTSTTLVCLSDGGVVLREPSVVAVERATGRIAAVGEDAVKRFSAPGANTLVIRPLRDGVIDNFDVAARMLRYFYGKVAGKRLFRPRAVVCVPAGVTEAEKRQFVEAVLEAGARYCYLIEEPLSATIGAGVDVLAPTGRMVVDIGGGTTDIAVISYGVTVLSASVRVAGDRFDDALIRYMQCKQNLNIGRHSAESIKLAYGRASLEKEQRIVDIRGRSVTSGEMTSVPVGTNELVDALAEPLLHIADCARDILRRTPPDLLHGIREDGVLLTGGGALLGGIDAYLTNMLELRCRIPEDPVGCVARGTGVVLGNLPAYAGAVTDYRRGEYYEGA